jgi:ATP-binding cassette subfamily F protein uup
VALARALVAEADLLVLDEPTNHLDIDSIAWLEQRLASFPGALLVVTHDRHFLDRVTTRIIELDRGRAYVHDGGYSSYLEDRAQRAEKSDAAEAKRQNLARAELAWLRRGAPARTSKPRARVEAAEKLLAEGKQAEARSGVLPLHGLTPRLGNRVVELHGVGHGYGARTLFEGVELLLDPRERLGVVGPNGSGKSTLLDIMAGRIQPDSGTVEVGTTVRLATFDQQGRELDPSLRVREAVAGPGNPVDWTHEALMESFWFDADAQRAPVGMLSGGERRRLQLLLVLARKPNVLLLDEPTNDLDAETLRQFEHFLEHWPGAVVAVSHDRAFLERVVADVIVLGDGSASRLPGGYAAYEQRRRELQASAGGRRVAGAAATPRHGDRDDSRGSGGSGSRGSSRDGARASGPKQPSPSTLRHRLRSAEREVESARQRCDELHAAMESAGSDHAAMAALGAELAEATGELDSAENAWLELADEVEQRGLEI